MNYINKRAGFETIIKNALTIAGGYSANSIVATFDDDLTANPELHIALLDDNLIDRIDNEGFGMLFEKREFNFDIFLRYKNKTTKNVFQF